MPVDLRGGPWLPDHLPSMPQEPAEVYPIQPNSHARGLWRFVNHGATPPAKHEPWSVAV